MKRKYMIQTLAILSTTILLLTGCNENNNEAVPATSDAVVEEIQAEETEVPTTESEIESVPTNDNPTTSTEDSLSESEIADIEVDVDTEDETTEYQENLDIESSGGGEDTIDEEGDYTEASNEQSSETETATVPSSSTYTNFSEEWKKDTNNGKGFELDGVHYETRYDWFMAGLEKDAADIEAGRKLVEKLRETGGK